MKIPVIYAGLKERKREMMKKSATAKKPVKKYAMGGGIPVTRQDPANSNVMPTNNVGGSMPKQQQMMAQQSEMLKSSLKQPSNAYTGPAMGFGGQEAAINMKTANPPATPAKRRYTSADALRYLRRTGNKAGADEILKGAVGKQFTMPADFAKGGVVKKKATVAKGKKK